MQTVTSADGTRIAYDQTGEGPPLVLLHGGATHRYWDPVLDLLADDFALVRPDRRGRGESGDGDEYSIQREVADARALVDAVDGAPVLFGHSFGGLQAIEAATDGGVAAVAAYEPAYLPDGYRERANLAARMQAHLDAGERREAMKRHFEEVLFGGDVDDFDAWLAEWPAWPDVVRHVETAVRMDRALEAHPLPDSLDVDAPALVLSGTRGPPHLRESAHAVHDALPNSRFVDFDGVGHSGPSEAPRRVVAELRTFLDAHLDGRTSP